MLRFNIFLFTFTLLILFKHGVVQESSVASNVTIHKTLHLIQEADKIIQSSTTKEAILVLGVSGVGKTPFTKWMTQDNTKLMSVQKNEDEPFMMEYTENNMGTNTLLSETEFPTLYMNASTKTTFYDFPGFHDTRGVDYDIATTYATKGVVNKTERVKLIFLVDYDSVKIMATRDGFLNFLQCIFQLVTDINKFNESIAMVVSKVPRYVDNKEASDEKVIKNVINFINTKVSSFLQNRLKNDILSDEEKTFNDQALSFISIILGKNNTNNTRIGLFRLPDQAGPFSNISLVQNGQRRVEQIINKLNFTVTAQNDFNYVLSDKAKIKTDEITREMNNKINSFTGKIGQNIKLFFFNKEKNNYDIKKLHEELGLMYNKLSNAHMLANNLNIKQCAELVEKNTINFCNFSLNTMKSYSNFIFFLQNINITKFEENCFQGFETIIDYLNASQKWYKFLLNILDKLSDYNIQKNITACKQALLDVNIKYENNQTVIQNTLQHFLEECLIDNHEFDHLKDTNLDEFKLNALNRILNYTLRYTSNLLCDPNSPEKLVLRGRYVKFSDITNINCSKPVKIIEIFASNKVFIDTSLNKTGANLQLFIIAPIWDIQNEQNITLDGLRGKAHEQTKANNGEHPGNNGENGNPGLPGNSAGIFLGVGEIFLNAEKLTISANGGSGGQGQDGGDGINGKNGFEPEMALLKSSSIVRPELYMEKDSIKIEEEVSGHYNQFLVRIYNRNCTSGGNGGAGGKGGYGGKPGVYFFPLIKNVTIPNLLNNTGKLGLDGIGGQKGNAGEPGKLTVLYKEKYSMTRSYGATSNTYTLMNSSNLLQCQDGKSGINGSINSDTVLENALLPNFVPIINDYKNYLRGNLIDDQIPINYFSIHFHDLLENETQKYYGMSGFVNELYNLENQFIWLLKNEVFFENEFYDLDLLNTRSSKKNMLSFFYKSLLKRINDYNDYETEEKELMNYLCIAILSKICIIDDDLDNYLIIDVENYFKNTRENILGYTKALKEVRRNSHEEKFLSILDTEIGQANIIIMDQILPEIDQLIDQTNNAIKLLIEEAKDIKRIAEENEHDINDKLQKLKDQLALKHILGFLQISSVFLAFTGPVGAAAGAVIAGTSTVIETFGIDNSALPDGVNKQILKFTELIQKKQQELIIDIDVAELELAKHSAQYSYNFTDIKTKLTEKRRELQMQDKHNVRYTTLKKFEKIRTEITELLNNKKTLLKQEKSQTDIQLNNRMKVLNSITTIINAGEVAADVYSKIQIHKAKIDTASIELKNFQDYIDKVKKDEQAIYDTISPIFKNISKYSNLSHSSHAELYTNTWQLQSKVKDLQFQLQQMTDKLTMKESVNHCILQFENAILTMIRIYDHIQDYKNQAQLATYIKSVNSDAKPTNQFSNDFDRLELMIKSNLVMEEYQKGIDAFKQHIFPFAYLYLDQFNHFPNEKLLEMKNITILVNDAVNQMNKFHNELEKEKNIINEKYHTYRYFNVDFTGEHSFYTWKYDDYKENIIKVLQGNAIVFESDVKQSSKINAIRFNKIGVSFKCKNNVTQSQLNNELNKFKISMTHLGNSHYRFKDNFYIILHKKVTIIHSVNRNNNETYTGGNEVFKKIEQNDPLLSPYAFWEIKLEHQIKNHETDNNFSSLSNYTNEEIDLILEGYGSYIDQNIPIIRDSDVRKYYKRAFT